MNAPFISDCVRMKKVSSAPLYEPENSENTIDEPTSCQSGMEQWCEAIEKHMPLILHHTSAVVRAASVTCFAGITSSVYFSFSKEKQDFILSSCLGQLLVEPLESYQCFLKFLKEILDEFVHVVEINTRDPLVSVQWNVCHALSNLFLNETLRLQDMDWASSVCSILLLLLRDSSNFKIRIQAASALAVPASILDYGESFSDVIQGLVHILENQGSDRIASPSNFKYRVALENQLTSTVLHVLILTSSSDHEPVKDFLVKKASFLEDWFKALCLSLGETTSSQAELEDNKSIRNPKKEIGTLIQLYNSRKHHAIEQKFEKLANSIQ